jgi:transcriptional regulator with XRE-family HTH domain
MEQIKLETYTPNIGLNIKKCRVKNNMTQKQLADKLSVTHFWICKLESGKRNTTIFMLQNIANVLQVDFLDLII